MLTQHTNAVEAEISADIAILGGGPGGYVAAIYAAKKGQKVVLIEKYRLGGTCLNVGCIPTKSLVKSSELFHEALNADVFGIEIPEVHANMDKVIDHKNHIVEKLVNGIEYLMDKNAITVITGNGEFVDPHTLSVADSNVTVHADNIIIATGSTFRESKLEGLDLPFVVNSTQALDSREIPESITILGGSVTGLEFACIYNNLGCEVHVLKATDSMHGGVDKDVSKDLIRMLKKKGIDITLSAKMKRVSESEDGKAVVTYEKDDKEYQIVSQKVMNALGRRPVVEGFGLDKTGVELNENGRGIKVDRHLRTNVPGIYAIGDVTNINMQAHVASKQGIIAVDNIIGNEREIDYSAVPSVIFTSPEVAVVGATEENLKKEGIPCTTSKFKFAGNGKALTMEQGAGYVKLIRNDETGLLAGAQIIGPDASTLINAVTVAITNHMTEDAITETIFPHPTTGEAVHEAALGLGIGYFHQ